MVTLTFFRGDNVGSDFPAYIKMIKDGEYDLTIEDVKTWYDEHGILEKGNTNSTNKAREFGFAFYISTLYNIFGSAKTALNITVILISIIFLCTFKKLCKNDTHTCLFIYISTFLFFSSFNTIRQSLATALIFLGGALIYLKRYSLSIIPIFISSTIHFSSITIIPLLVVSYFIKINKKVSLAILLILLFTFLLNIEFSPIINLLPSDIAGRNIKKGFHEGEVLTYNVYIHYLSFIFQGIMIYTYYWFYSKSDKKDTFIYNLWFFGLVLYLTLMSSPNVGRISEFLYAFQIPAITITLSKLRDHNARNFTAGKQLVLIYCIIWYSFYALRNFYGLQPYIKL